MQNWQIKYSLKSWKDWDPIFVAFMQRQASTCLLIPNLIFLILSKTDLYYLEIIFQLKSVLFSMKMSVEAAFKARTHY